MGMGDLEVVLAEELQPALSRMHHTRGNRINCLQQFQLIYSAHELGRGEGWWRVPGLHADFIRRWTNLRNAMHRHRQTQERLKSSTTFPKIARSRDVRRAAASLQSQPKWMNWKYQSSEKHRKGIKDSNTEVVILEKFVPPLVRKLCHDVAPIIDFEIHIKNLFHFWVQQCFS